MDGSPEIAALAQTFVGLGLLRKKFLTSVAMKDLEHELLLLIYQPQKIGSVRELTLRMRHNGAVVRDRFSVDTWRILNQLQVDSRTRPGRLPLANALALLNTLVVDLAAFSGMEMENMTRGHGWRFLDFGRRLERATNLIKVLGAGLVEEVKTSAALEPLLEIADSAMTYRRRYFAQAQLAPVLELLLADETNPRSLAFQLRQLAEHATHLPRDPVARVNETAGRVTELADYLRSTDLRALARGREAGAAMELKTFLRGCAAGFESLSNQVSHHYFSHTVPQVS